MMPLVSDERFVGIRTAFPITRERAYLFAGGMAPLSTPAREALDAYAALWAADPVTAYREHPRLEAARLRACVASFIGARPEDVALLDSTSRGNNLLAQMVPAPRGSNVVVDATTYRSALYPWLLRGIEVRRVPGALPDAERLSDLVDDDTAAVSVSHVCPLTGFRHDLRRLAEVAHAHDACLLVDGAQSVGALRLDAEASGVDGLAFGAMKWLLGTPGIGFLWLRPALAATLLPPQAGPAGAHVEEGELRFVPGAARHELSSLHWGGLAASCAGMELLASAPPAEVESRILDLSGRVVEGLLARGLHVWTPRERERRAGVVALRCPQAVELQAFLRERCVDVWGWERDQRVRVDPHVYNDQADVDRFFAGLDAFLAGRQLSDDWRQP
jgi:selenocysteine lyase/cysteine desulfurase